MSGGITAVKVAGSVAHAGTVWNTGKHTFPIPLRPAHAVLWGLLAARLANALVSVIGKRATTELVANAVQECQG